MAPTQGHQSAFPAALCGIVGYKPTFGLVSTDGIVTLSWSMDHAGLQAKTAEDVAHMMNALQGVDPQGTLRLWTVPGTTTRTTCTATYAGCA